MYSLELNTEEYNLLDREGLFCFGMDFIIKSNFDLVNSMRLFLCRLLET